LTAGGDTWLPQSIEYVRDLPNKHLSQFSFLYLESPDVFLTVGGKYHTNQMSDENHIFTLTSDLETLATKF
jgi:hypothetical protein